MKCNKDCFHCQYKDCIYDRLDYSDFEVDIYEEPDRKKLLVKARNSRYRASHKQEVNARSCAWNNAHKEKVLETSRQWQKENKQRVAATKRKRYAENPDYYRQKQREYRARRKEEVGKDA